MFHESHSKRSSSLTNAEVVTTLALNFIPHPMLPDGVDRLVEWANSLFFENFRELFLPGSNIE